MFGAHGNKCSSELGENWVISLGGLFNICEPEKDFV